jgi:hypothetical protein
MQPAPVEAPGPESVPLVASTPPALGAGPLLEPLHPTRTTHLIAISADARYTSRALPGSAERSTREVDADVDRREVHRPFGRRLVGKLLATAIVETPNLYALLPTADDDVLFE